MKDQTNLNQNRFGGLSVIQGGLSASSGPKHGAARKSALKSSSCWTDLKTKLETLSQSSSRGVQESILLVTPPTERWTHVIS